MIEEIVIQYLADKFKEYGINVSAEVPENPFPRMIIVEKTGSSRTNYITTSTLAIQSYAESLYESAKLNEAVKEAMDDIITLDEVSASRLSGDYNYTDTSTKRYRYQAVYSLTHY